jgi:hypothetical protein
MAGVYENIEVMKDRITQGEGARVSGLIRLYSSGVTAKLRNSEYALSMLNNLYTEVGSTSTSTGEFPALEGVHFYLDAFFAFLYSTFDVMAQVVNQKFRMGEDERKVSFRKIKDKLDQNHQATAIQQKFKTISNAIFFKNLEKYRNCSTHRRQIYTECKVITTTVTPGYSTTLPSSVIIMLCDDPLILNPKVAQNREMISYCSKICDRVKKEILQITIIL